MQVGGWVPHWQLASVGGQGSVSSLFVSPHLMIIAGKSNIGRKLVTCCFFFTDIG